MNGANAHPLPLSLFAPRDLPVLFPSMPREAEDNELPDLQRPGIGPVGPAIARAVGDAALSLTYRLVQARSRDPFTAPAESAPTRLYYTSDDGWRAPLFRFDPAPGGAGEPVLLAHGLGGSSRDWSIEPARCLAHALSAAGFSVYALEHRGDRSALPPEHARPFSVDDVATRDLGAAVDAVRAQTGFDRVLLVGHGLGGQVIYLRLALDGDEGIAGVVTMGAPVRFSAPASATRQAALAAMLLPAGWVLPGRRAQQLASPFVASGEDVASPGTTGPAARARLRYASGDLHGGVVKQAMRWIATGHLTDATGRLDVVAALSSFGPRRRAGGAGPLPSLVVVPDADPACPPGAALPAAEALGAEVLALSGGWGHLDPLLAARAPAEVHARVVASLDGWRERCW